VYPLLYDAGPLIVRSYGLALVLSFLAGMWLARARARRAGVDPRHMARLFLLILLAAVIGSRLLHMVENAASYAADPWRAGRIWEGGLSMYGGVLLAFAVSAAYTRAIGVPFLTVADVCAPSLALGEALTRRRGELRGQGRRV
jgi:phosphatidylglycerol:prolipoprotein diacylglycerol transferase